MNLAQLLGALMVNGILEIGPERPGQRFGVRNENGHHAVLERIAIDEYLAHVLALGVDVLELLGRDVFALRQLEEILFTVDDFQGSVLKDD